MQAVNNVFASPERGLDGDRYQGRSGDRQVTLLQAEHLPVIASCAGHAQITPELLRRNILVQGINLLALRDKVITIGAVELAVTGLCHPCSRMEEILGAGGYNAMRGHGGVTARVLTGGPILIGDSVSLKPVSAEANTKIQGA
jgi:MOSC domain-containing protein YiiM